MARGRFLAAVAGIVLAFAGIAHAAWATVTRGDLPYGGGPVMTHASVYPIFWLPAGYHFHQTSGPLTDTEFVALQTRFLHDVQNTAYLRILSQYFDGAGHIAPTFTVHSPVMDAHPFPQGLGTVQAPLTRARVDAEVVRLIAQNRWRVAPAHTLFLVYTPLGVQTCDDSGSECSLHPGLSAAGICGYHRSFVHHGVRYADALISDEVIPCQSWQQGLSDAVAPNGDTLADIAIDITAHELFEALTDPFATGWAASNDTEIADKCAAITPRLHLDGGDILLHGHAYLLQMEWSNQEHACVLATG